MATVEVNTNLDSSLRENRVFPPPAEFAAKAHIKSLAQYEEMYRRSVEKPEEFWADAARELDWFAPWTKVIDGEAAARQVVHQRKAEPLAQLRRPPRARRSQGQGRAPVGGRTRRGPQADLRANCISRCSASPMYLKGLGVKRGDRVAIYMGMSPELAIAMLACARIGAVHSVIFGGFAAHAISDRVNDSSCVAVITQDTSYRRGAEVQLKAIVDEALEKCPTVKNVVVFRRSGSPVTMQAGRDLWWHDAMEKAAPECPPEWMDAEDPLYLLYTSGTTGKPKGLLHTTGGYSVQTYLTSKYVFDLRDDDVYWCTADIGWVTGHSYVVYGPLQNGATVMMYEGAPNWPENDRFWKIVDAHKVTDLLHRAHRHPRLHQVGRLLGRETTRSPRCACSAPSASPSIPSRGCGITA